MLKKFLALVLAGAMVLGSVSMAYASEGTGSEGGAGSESGTGSESGSESGTGSATATTPTSGSITISSPVVGATYHIYKIFDETTNAAVDAFSYSIDSNNQFFDAVMAYANMPAAGATEEDANTDGLSLIVSADTAGASIKTYNVLTTDAFDAYKFAKYLQTALSGGQEAVAADPTATPPVEAQEAIPDLSGATTAASDITVTVDKSSTIKFDSLPLGYFLVNATYPKADYGTVSMTPKKYDGTDLDPAASPITFSKSDLEDPEAETLTLKDDAKTKITNYVNAVVTDDYVQAYIDDKNLKDTDANGNAIDIVKSTEADSRWIEVKNEIITSMTTDATNKVLNGLANSIAAHESDINVKDSVLVFLDSSQPDAVIYEKNTLDTWDVPVNPTGDAMPKTDEPIPEHGEPEGGKNIVVTPDDVTPAVYADWSDAEIGESVHYQLRVNAMNFIQTGATADTVKQVKEYFLADYQSAQMHFDEAKKIKVTVWAGNNNNDSQATDTTPAKTNVTKNANGETVEYLDYTDKASTFFKNNSDPNVDGDFDKDDDIFGTGTGIMVPWVKVSAANPAEPDPAYPIYTTTKVPKVEGGNPVYKTEEPKMEGGAKVAATAPDGSVISGQYVSVNGNIINDQNQLLDKDNNPIQDYDTYYVYSLYNSDVTIVVDYYMILDDDAIVDEPGNKNFAQYGWSPVDNKNNDNTPKQPTPPSDEDKPDVKREVDEATVYTYALAWVKVDDKANQLAGAKFQLPFYVKTTKDGDAYVYGGKTAGTGLTNEITTTAESAVITIKGVEQGTYSITETEAPDGYNTLAAPFTVEAKKSGGSVTTKTTTEIKLDAQGNITEETATTTVTYNTDEDSYNKETPKVTGQETSVPVYQFDPVVNKQGTELPSTGGIGTTIFYAGGAILVLLAGVLLVSKRRYA